MSDNDLLAFNGINGDDGGYLLPELSAEQIAVVAQHKDLPPAVLAAIKERYDHPATRETDVQARDPDAAINKELGFRKARGKDSFRIDGNTMDLAQTGWGVIFARDTDPALIEALRPLLDHRRQQVDAPPVASYTSDGKALVPKKGIYVEYTNARGYRANESKNDFLKRQGMGPGAPNPATVPYYLLIVGDPAQIPYTFQYQLDVQYAVGRLHFDTPEEYAKYAANVVAVETGAVQRPRQAAFFGVSNPDDPATQLSAKHLIPPLIDALTGEQPTWQITQVIGEGATRARLGKLLGGDETPALLFTASHGMGFRKGSERQVQHQGALLCQDWPGPKAHQGPVPETYYFSADDLSSDANVRGLIAFFFACYGAGTPELDEFSRGGGQRVQIADQPFVARLPQALLRAGALAVVGHVERAWGYSFYWDRAGTQIEAYKKMVSAVMYGQPVGAATDWLNERYAELSTDLTDILKDIEENERRVDATKLATFWTATNDARNYVIIGDPAVRLPLGNATAAQSAAVAPPVAIPTNTPAAAVTPNSVPEPMPVSPAASFSVTEEASPVPAPVPVPVVRPSRAARPVPAPATRPVPAPVTQPKPVAEPASAPAAVSVSEPSETVPSAPAPTRPADQPSVAAPPAVATVVSPTPPEPAEAAPPIPSATEPLAATQMPAVQPTVVADPLAVLRSNIVRLSAQVAIGSLDVETSTHGDATGHMVATQITASGSVLHRQELPRQADGQIDAGLWAIHMETLRMLQAQRIELLQALTALARQVTEDERS